MTTEELVTKISRETGLTKKSTRIFMRGFAEVIKQCLLDDEIIRFQNVGTWRVVTHEQKKVRNPATKEIITLPILKHIKWMSSPSLVKELRQEKTEKGLSKDGS